MNKVTMILFVLLIAVAQGSPVKSILSARDTSNDYTVQRYTAKDYIQDGLVAMWDGIENVGWGMHDANATNYWVDLIGSNNITLRGHPKDVPKIEKNGLVWENVNKSRVRGSFTPIASYVTLELVLRVNQNSGPCVINPVKQNGWQIVIINWNIGTGTNPSASNSKGVSISPEVPMTLSVEKPSVSETSSIFKNGQEVADAVSLGSWFTVNGGEVGSSGINRSFLGKIYAIRIYSKALSIDEIAHNYSIDKERFGL